MLLQSHVPLQSIVVCIMITAKVHVHVQVAVGCCQMTCFRYPLSGEKMVHMQIG